MLNFRKIIIVASIAAAAASSAVCAAETEPRSETAPAVAEADSSLPVDESAAETAPQSKIETETAAPEEPRAPETAQDDVSDEEPTPEETPLEQKYVDVQVLDPIRTEKPDDVEIEVTEHPSEVSVFETEFIDFETETDDVAVFDEADERNWKWSGDDELLKDGKLVLVSGDKMRAMTFSWLKKNLPNYVETKESEPEIRNILDWECEEVDLQDGADLFSWLSPFPYVKLNPVLDDDSDLFPRPSLELSLSDDGRTDEGSKYEWTCEIRPGGWKIIRNVRYLIEKQTETE